MMARRAFGISSRNARISGSVCKRAKVGGIAMAMWPVGSSRCAARSSFVCATRCRMPWQWSSSRRPASVSCTPRPWRSSSGSRNSTSSARTWRLSAGCATPSTSAALLKLPCSATCTKVSSWFRFTRGSSHEPCRNGISASVCQRLFEGARADRIAGNEHHRHLIDGHSPASGRGGRRLEAARPRRGGVRIGGRRRRREARARRRAVRPRRARRRCDRQAPCCRPHRCGQQGGPRALSCRDRGAPRRAQACYRHPGRVARRGAVGTQRGLLHRPERRGAAEALRSLGHR